MHRSFTIVSCTLALAFWIVPGKPVLASQGSDAGAVEVLRAAVAAELQASKTDKSIWQYKEENDTATRRALYNTIETRQGTLKRLLELNGHPVVSKSEEKELQRVRDYVTDTAAQAKARKAAAHDDAQATELLKMLPDAFLWTKVSETGDAVTLKFRPNPDFDPPDMQSRVLGIMAGEMIVSLPAHRIKVLRGKLTDDVRFGFGILGKLDRGGTFSVERREVGKGIWQITETHVHISGHALLFKTIGQEEDDVKTDWKPSPAQTLEQAASILTGS